jgi:hypothetical protein
MALIRKVKRTKHPEELNIYYHLYQFALISPPSEHGMVLVLFAVVLALSSLIKH